MFLGTYRHAVDTKGRVAIPARFREQLPTGPNDVWRGTRVRVRHPGADRAVRRPAAVCGHYQHRVDRGRQQFDRDLERRELAPHRRGDAGGIHAHPGPGGRATPCPEHVIVSAVLSLSERPDRPDIDPYFYKTS